MNQPYPTPPVLLGGDHGPFSPCTPQFPQVSAVTLQAPHVLAGALVAVQCYGCGGGKARGSAGGGGVSVALKAVPRCPGAIEGGVPEPWSRSRPSPGRSPRAAMSRCH